jgi:hypothetical protein
MTGWKPREHSTNAVHLFQDPPYDAWTLAAMFEAYAAARHELQIGDAPTVTEGMEGKLAARILKAIAAGECDPDRLTAIALRRADGRSDRRGVLNAQDKPLAR